MTAVPTVPAGTSQGRAFAVLGLVLVVVLGAHLMAVILAAVVAVIALALGFAIAIVVAESGWRTVPRCGVVSS